MNEFWITRHVPLSFSGPKYLVIGEDRLFFLDEITEEVWEEISEGLLTVVDLTEEAAFIDGEWTKIERI